MVAFLRSLLSHLGKLLGSLGRSNELASGDRVHFHLFLVFTLPHTRTHSLLRSVIRRLHNALDGRNDATTPLERRYFATANNNSSPFPVSNF